MGEDVSGAAVVDHGGRHQTEARVVVLVVVPLKERLAESTCVFDRPEPIREAGAIFQGAELTFRIRVVIGDMWPGMGLGDTAIREQQSHRAGLLKKRKR